MKNVLFVFAFTIFGWLAVNAQNVQEPSKIKDKDVPEVVRNAFDNQFDNTAMAQWKMKEGNYKVSFRQGLKKHMAEFSSSGELISKGEKVEKNDLPTPVGDAVKANYSNSNIDEVYRIEKNGETQYLVKLEGNPKKKVVYDVQGKVLTEKMEE
ncbi:MAG: PepSY-like domain-containing protein [Chitinophagaceae bacterium]|nr:PepSY-like domain-containing protein [Chitinophagaceae bacterium]